MSYGTRDKVLAETKAEEKRLQNPENRYEVQGHEWPNQHSVGDDREPTTWGIVEYVPYCEVMPFRHNGFLWIF